MNLYNLTTLLELGELGCWEPSEGDKEWVDDGEISLELVQQALNFLKSVWTGQLCCPAPWTGDRGTKLSLKQHSCDFQKSQDSS